MALPALEFPAELPVSAERERIATAIREHRVVIVCGETGSGKTTQLPKICAMAGRGRAGLIGHTQPRRLAATSVARRIAQELGSELGVHVGYKIRFGEVMSAGASIKLMTDGVLLAETLSDPLLRRYDTLIIDEAHERSLNIDFLLGYLRRLLDGPRRDDLRVVITSATIDAERFARHFGDQGIPAPVIEVSGRTYPVEIRYRPSDDDGARAGASADAGRKKDIRGKPRNEVGGRRDEDDETDLPGRIEAAIESLWRDGRGDVLVFLPGEREIRDVGEHLQRTALRGGLPGREAIEVLPLYARLSPAQQQQVFTTSNGRRIVLATNVAETSLTVPGIRYVVDPGTARVKRYRIRGKVEQLQIEPISRAAASQRAGRCGRVAAGVCVRLYDEADFERRPPHTDPEILRSSLAGVILRMKALRLGEVSDFPFIDPPSGRAVADGEALLIELGALDVRGELTPTGRQLARLPLDPRIGRMLLAAHEGGCLREVLVIAAALSSQDPRLRPIDAQQAADASHRRFVDEQSDFVGWVRLWQYWQGAQAGRREAGESNRALSSRLEREFLSVRRLREWADVHAQLQDTVREMRWHLNDVPADTLRIHAALLSGLLGNLGSRSTADAIFDGTHQTRFTLHPSSGLSRKPPKWVMAAELVDTGRLQARQVARTDPDAIERAARHLIVRQRGEPFWSRRAGRAMASERGVLYGLTIYANRKVSIVEDDPVTARELLIREALVAGDWPDQALERLGFIARNRKLVEEIEGLEHRIRRPELLADPGYLYDWFDARIPAEIDSVDALQRWYRGRVREEPSLLVLSRDVLMRKTADDVDSDSYPRQARHRGASFALDYRFEPGSTADGVTMTIPLALLNQVDPARCEWLVPGMLRAKVEELLRSLPQRLRRHLVPVPEYASGFARRWAERFGQQALVDALRDDVEREKGLRLANSDFRPEQLSVHLLMNFVVVDGHGARLGDARSLDALRARFGERAKSAFQEALQGAIGELALPPGPALEETDPPPAGGLSPVALAESTRGDAAVDAGGRFTDWGFGALPELMSLRDAAGVEVIGFPAIVDRGDAVELAVFDEPAAAAEAHAKGLSRLFALALREPLRFFERKLTDLNRLSLAFSGFGSTQDLKQQLQLGLIRRVCLSDPWPTDAERFDARIAEARPRLLLVGQELVRLVGEVLAEYAVVLRKRAAARTFPHARTDIDAQLEMLMPPDFIVATPPIRLAHFPRYLKALAQRLDDLPRDPDRDADRTREIGALLKAYQRLRAARRGHPDARLDDLRWMIEELRVSLFAQRLRTPMPVSVKRLHRLLESIQA